MAKKECIFCKIVRGEAPAYKIYEDKNSIAILDIYPNIKGQTVVISKRHMTSYAFNLRGKELMEFIISVRGAARRIEKGLGVKRVNLIFEGVWVRHLHAKLFPAIGVDRKFRHVIAEEREYFNAYPGFVTSMMGPRALDKDLEKIQTRITGK